MTATTAAARKALELIAADTNKADAVLIAEAELGTDSLAVVEYAQTHTYNYSTGEQRTYTTRMTVRDNGRTSTGLKGDTKAVTRKLAAVLAEDAEDARIIGQLTGLIRNAADVDELVALEAPAVGDVAYAYAMGRTRRGLVTKVTKTSATVAYTTASSAGRVFRKVVKLAELLTDTTPAGVDRSSVEHAARAAAVNVPAACPVLECAEGEAHVAGSNVCTSTPAPAELTEAEHRAAAGWDAVEEGASFDADLDAQQAADDEERARELEEELGQLAAAGVHPGRIAELREDSTAEERAAELEAHRAAVRAEEPVPAEPGDLITVKLVAGATARHGGTSVTGYLVADGADGIVLREYPRPIRLDEVDRVSIVLRAGDQLRA